MRKLFAVLGVLMAVCRPVLAEPAPLYIVGDDDLSAYSSAWHAILKEAGIRAQFITVQQEQRRRLFVEGRMAADCCTIPEWRQRPEELAAQLYTEPFFYAVDHVIYRADDPAPPRAITELKTRRIATVFGYDYVGAEHFGPRIVVPSIDAAMQAVADGTADVVIVNIQEYMRRQRMKKRPLKVGIESTQVALRARVFKTYPELVPRLNAAIVQLRKSGRIEALVGASLRGGAQGGHTVPHP